jgi:hypothetical protein
VFTIWVCNFWRKNFGAKAAHKMLVKLTPDRQIRAATTRFLKRVGIKQDYNNVQTVKVKKVFKTKHLCLKSIVSPFHPQWNIAL